MSGDDPTTAPIEESDPRVLADDVENRLTPELVNLGDRALQQGTSHTGSREGVVDEEDRHLTEFVAGATQGCRPVLGHPVHAHVGRGHMTGDPAVDDRHPRAQFTRTHEELLDGEGEWPPVGISGHGRLGAEDLLELGEVGGSAFTDEHGHNLHGMPRGRRRNIPVVTAQPLIGVLAVQGDVREHVRALELAGARTIAVRRPSEVEAIDGLVIPGGESTTMDKLVRIFDLHEPLVSRLRTGLPAYGSCAGMIMLADRILDGHRDQQTLGGLDITVRRNAFGRQVDSFEEDLRIRELGPEPVRAVFIRAPWVEDIGDDVQVLASVHVAGGDHPVAVRQGNLLATSFHPEVTGDHRFHQYFVDMVRVR